MTTTTPQFKRFQLTYLVVYAVMMAADWLQGPYQYELYMYYQYDRGDIGLLFIAGFGASAIFGTFAGSMADKYGRKLNAILYAVLYGASCVTKHYRNFWILMFGRFLGGIATSILFSAFESWMVAEHSKRQYNESWITHTFSYMFMTNFGVAIASGFLGQAGVSYYGGNPVAAFDLSMACCVLGGILVLLLWDENYGNTGGDSVMSAMKTAVQKVSADRKLWLLGSIQSCFEAAMYAFVFMWTPAIKQGGDVPLGIVFSCFMISSAFGGYIYKYLAQKWPVERVLRVVFAVSLASMVVPIVTSHQATLAVAFCVFEATVGIFWPGIGTLRSRYVPEEERATIMNLFRIPLNVLVCILLLKVGDLSISTVFIITSAMHAMCFGMQTVLVADIDAAIAAKDAPSEREILNEV